MDKLIRVLNRMSGEQFKNGKLRYPFLRNHTFRLILVNTIPPNKRTIFVPELKSLYLECEDTLAYEGKKYCETALLPFQS